MINSYARKNNILKDNEDNLTGDDIREGMTAIISVKVPEPQFEGQTKTKLGNSEVRGICDTITGSNMAQFMEENPSIAKKMIEKSRNAARAREAARKAREMTRRKTCWKALLYRANWRTAPQKSQLNANCFWWKGTPPAALPKADETETIRPFCHCAARS